MNNAEWMIQNGYKFRDIRVGFELDNIITFSLNGAIVGTAPYNETCLTTVIAWLEQEHKEPILDEAEKNYLSAVIKPFRNRVQYIAKVFADDAWFYRINCYIFIHFNDGSDDMDFPVFNESKMYKGMAIDRPYTLKELGL